MRRRSRRPHCSTALALLIAALMAAASSAVHAQTSGSWSPADVPRFLLVSTDSTQPPAVVDPSDVPMLRRRIAVHLSGATRREALRQIARASGLEFVYANDLVPPGDSVRLQADDITVAAALTEVLLGAGVDVAIGADGNAILVRRAVIVAQVPKKDVVRGRVTTDSGTAIAGADAIVTMAPTVETFRTLTDSSGNYSVTITDGSGEYLLFVGAPGRKSFRQRLTRTGGDTTFVVNVKLASNATTTMATVRVQARRPRPTRSLGAEGQAGTDGTDRTVDGMFGALPPDLQGNLDAMAQLVPGLTVGTGGPTAFGLGAGDNKTMLNGLSFGAADLPRDAVTKSRYTTSAWDPSVGGFSG
ncbi:MAG TPA: carboxypeptidase-like regulatory domain-containing protein, partial [Gemmatimonadaceae bacterium]